MPSANIQAVIINQSIVEQYRHNIQEIVKPFEVFTNGARLHWLSHGFACYSVSASRKKRVLFTFIAHQENACPNALMSAVQVVDYFDDHNYEAALSRLRATAHERLLSLTQRSRLAAELLQNNQASIYYIETPKQGRWLAPLEDEGLCAHTATRLIAFDDIQSAQINIFASLNNKPRNTIMLHGLAGTGKSTLCLEALYQQTQLCPAESMLYVTKSTRLARQQQAVYQQYYGHCPQVPL